MGEKAKELLESPVVKKLAAAMEPKKEPEADTRKIKSLKDLIFLGKSYETVEISGFIFEISTLTAKENKEVFIYLFSKYGDTWAMHNQTATLAHAIRSVNGVPLESVYEEEVEISAFEKKLHVLDSMSSILVNKLFVNWTLNLKYLNLKL
jgi:hypothetical protein